MLTRQLTMTSRFQPLMDFNSKYGNNIKRIETVTKQIIEIDELREEKLQSIAQDKFRTVIKVTPSSLH